MSEEQEQKPKWHLSLKEGNLGKRLLIAGILLLSLASFIHFKEVRVEILELDTHAKNYVVAQTDFEFPDEEGTVILKQESARDISTIYKLDIKEIEKRRTEFEGFLIRDQRWRQFLPNTTFNELYQGADRVTTLLLDMRFTDVRTLKRLDSLKLKNVDYFLLPSSYDGNYMVLPEIVWKGLQKKLLDQKNNVKIDKATIRYIFNYFQSIKWELEQDVQAQRSLRRRVETTVPERFSIIKAGSMIVDQGEKVTQRHIAMLQAMKKALTENRKIWEPLPLLGTLIFAIIIVLIGGYYFYKSHKDLVYNIHKLALYATIIILTLIIAKVTEYFLLRNVNGLFEMVRYPLFVPFASILLRVLLGKEIALFSAFLLSVILGLSLAVDHTWFIVLNLIAGVVAILACRHLRKRKEVFVVCGKVWLACIPLFFVYSFSQDVFWNVYIVSDLISTFIFLILTSIFIVGLLPILESIFHVMTDITLMEYMDPNSELLRRLSVEAPGTYQHCLVVGSIAEAAAQAIDANGLFCRVSTLYHDIGKLFNPHYFTENQMGDFNIHQLLTPIESTQVIVAHVTEGEGLARKHGLPQSFINIIREHHGTTLVYYFYCKQVEQMEKTHEKVDQNQFRYPGPKPRSKESAIIMMADTVEAASRSIEDVTEKSISELVNRLIEEKVSDGQFDECQLTFEEFGIVKETIIKTLSVARHLRIKYPQKKPSI